MKFILLAILLLGVTSANAFQNEQHLNSSTEEERAEVLFKNIRCMVCAGESLAESNADLAEGMRKLIRDKISEGESDQQIENYLTARYGPQILQKPPFGNDTYLLWFAPVLIFFIGIIIIVKLR